MATGNGASHLNEILGVMNIPGLGRQTFSQVEQEISDWWGKALKDEMLAAGAEERRIAIENGNFHQGVPAVTVICDGGWSKRTHKHTYNASGGVAIIVGRETGKILHIGVRNKYCYICEKANNNKTEAKQHRCFKNWGSSSQAMESDIIVEGFKAAEQTHGVRYMKVIADGDSSVYARIQEDVDVWGKDVVKLECANHICKCLRSSLEKLVEDNPYYKGKGKLTKAVRIHIVSAVRCVIRLRGQVNDKHVASKLMAHDIKNSIHHIFGKHDNCSDFCKAGSGMTPFVPPGNEMHDNVDDVDELLINQAAYWTDGTSESSQQASRQATSLQYDALDKNMICDVSLLLDRVAKKADRLNENVTTNIAESWMHVRSKFDGGKVYNLCNRGSWHARCYGAAVRQNLGPKWAPDVWSASTGTVAGHYFSKLYERQHREHSQRKERSRKPHCKKQRWRKKMMQNTCRSNKDAKLAYGPKAIDVTQDATEEQLKVAKEDYLKKHIHISDNRLSVIENQTLKQSESQVWRSERKKRITASNFGPIFRRNPNIKVKPLVENLLYSNFRGTPYTTKGLHEERISIQEYILKKADNGVNVQVEPTGMVIDRKHKFLAASPDGKVMINGKVAGLVEIKNVLLNKPITLSEAAKENKSFCLEMINGKLQLKNTHKFYYQIQGQLNICDLPWADLIVRTTNPYQLHIEQVTKDTQLWNEMVAKLFAFYDQAILPELAIPRHGHYPGIREPGTWYSSQPSRKRKHQVICNRDASSVSDIQPNRPITSTPTPLPPAASAHSPIPQTGLHRETSAASSAKIRKVTRKAALKLKDSSSIASIPSTSPTGQQSTPAAVLTDVVNTTSLPVNIKKTEKKSKATEKSSTYSIQPPARQKPSTPEPDIVPPKVQKTKTTRVLKYRTPPSSSPQDPSSVVQSEVRPSTSNIQIPSEKTQDKRRPSRSVHQKFVGRRISHKWTVDDSTNTTQWYEGTVLDVIRGKDGELSACYEVLYDGDESPYEVNHLLEDFRKSCVKLLDL